VDELLFMAQGMAKKLGQILLRLQNLNFVKVIVNCDCHSFSRAVGKARPASSTTMSNAYTLTFFISSTLWVILVAITCTWVVEIQFLSSYIPQG
jgi:hypothetical protein